MRALVEAAKDGTVLDTTVGPPGVDVLQAPAQVAIGHQPPFAAADADGQLAAERLAQILDPQGANFRLAQPGADQTIGCMRPVTFFNRNADD